MVAVAVADRAIHIEEHAVCDIYEHSAGEFHQSASIPTIGRRDKQHRGLQGRLYRYLSGQGMLCIIGF